MKKNIISAAVAATLLGASAANAVFVNPEGHGQVLIYPYYTVEGGHDTYINLVNTTNETKAVKVRFVEAMTAGFTPATASTISPPSREKMVIRSRCDPATYFDFVRMGHGSSILLWGRSIRSGWRSIGLATSSQRTAIPSR